MRKGLNDQVALSSIILPEITIAKMRLSHQTFQQPAATSSVINTETGTAKGNLSFSAQYKSMTV